MPSEGIDEQLLSRAQLIAHVGALREQIDALNAELALLEKKLSNKKSALRVPYNAEHGLGQKPPRVIMKKPPTI